jgi:hypothetical protein
MFFRYRGSAASLPLLQLKHAQDCSDRKIYGKDHNPRDYGTMFGRLTPLQAGKEEIVRNLIKKGINWFPQHII